MILLAACRGPEERVFVSVHPELAWVLEEPDRRVDGGTVLSGREARALLDGIALGDDATLVDPDGAPTHEVRARGAIWWVQAGASELAGAQRELALRLDPILRAAPTQHGHWVQVPATMSVPDALGRLDALGLPAFPEPLRRRSPWVRVRWATATRGDPDTALPALEARRTAFTDRLVATLPGVEPFQESEGSEGRPSGLFLVHAEERYNFPFPADLRAVEALVRAEGAEIEEENDPLDYLVAVWTEGERAPDLPAPFEVVGSYFPVDE